MWSTRMSLKRSMSDDSECEDLFSDTKDSSDHTNSSTTISCGGGNGGGGGHTNRKKRRGIIEKRRRDRINNSLTELRRLVPTAFEKQGSAKLEKAEILQMTVDHLKMLHAKGLDALAYDPHKFAMDYHSIGFRECATEIARYLVTQEGMDIQDPLRLRLMSHLQCFAAQRELANKQASASTWGVGVGLNSALTAAVGAAQHHTSGMGVATATPYSHHFNSHGHHGGGAGGHMEVVASSPMQHAQQQQYAHSYGSLHGSPSMPNESLLNNSQHHGSSSSSSHQQQQVGAGGVGLYSGGSPTSTATAVSAAGVLVPNPMVMSHYHHHHQGGLLSGGGSGGGGGGSGGNSGHSHSTSAYIPNGKPPHRPWGAELAY